MELKRPALLLCFILLLIMAFCVPYSVYAQLQPQGINHGSIVPNRTSILPNPDLSLSAAKGHYIKNAPPLGPSSFNQAMGANITSSVAIDPLITKAIASQVHVSLANVSMIAEKAVGANAHASAARIGVVNGFLVYMALVLDSNNNFHGVLVDPGNGKVLISSQISLAALMRLFDTMTSPGLVSES